MTVNMYEAHLWIDLREELEDKVISSFSLGYDGKLYVLTTYSKDNKKHQMPNGMIYPRLRTDKPNDFVVYIVDSTQVQTYIIPKQKWNYHSVQPLPDAQLLLVCSRANRKIGIKNANVFDFDGVFQRAFTLGDAILSTQTTSIGEIWTSYFDEYFTEYDKIVGLHRWDKDGKEVYRYQYPAGLDLIFDCYAMNVTTDDTVWIYYYTDFPLVKISHDKVLDYWHPPIKGSHWLAVHNNHIVFVGSYDDRLFHHFEVLPNHQIKHTQTFDIAQKGWYTTRGKTIVICEDNQFYRFDVPELLRRR